MPFNGGRFLELGYPLGGINFQWRLELCGVLAFREVLSFRIDYASVGVHPEV